MECFRTRRLGLGLLIPLMLGLLACSHTPVEPSPAQAEVRQQVGVLGFTFPGPALLTVEAKPLRGAGEGAKTGASTALRGTLQGAFTHGNPQGSAGLIMLSPGIVAVGALVGAAVAPSAADVEEAEAVLDHTVTDRRLLAAIRDPLLQALQSQAPHGVRLLPDLDPRAEDAHLAQAVWAREGLRNVLEVQGPWITLAKSGCAGSINPALRLSVSLGTRVIRTADGEVLYSSSFEHRGEARTFTAWAANDAQPLREALDRAADTLSQQIATRLFGLAVP